MLHRSCATFWAGMWLGRGACAGWGSKVHCEDLLWKRGREGCSTVHQNMFFGWEFACTMDVPASIQLGRLEMIAEPSK